MVDREVSLPQKVAEDEEYKLQLLSMRGKGLGNALVAARRKASRR